MATEATSKTEPLSDAPAIAMNYLYQATAKALADAAANATAAQQSMNQIAESSTKMGVQLLKDLKPNLQADLNG